VVDCVVPAMATVELTYKLPSPAPPATLKAPVVVDDDVSVRVVVKLPDEVIDPTEVILLVPSAKLPLNVMVPPMVVLPPTDKFCPIPTPPMTVNAPVVVDVELTELNIETIPFTFCLDFAS